jgi:hypothetical protein
VPLWDALFNAMRTSRRRRIRPDEAERLLAAGHDPDHPELSRLVAAASAPPRPDELVGLDAALAAFEAAGPVERPAPARRRRQLLRPLAAAAATAAALVGGVATAAEVGYLPGDDRPAADVRIKPRDVSTSTAIPSTTSAPARRPDPTRGSQTKDANARRFDRLCRKWDKRHQKGKALKSDDLSELAAAAGGESRIPAFCAPRLAPSGHATTPPSATHPSPSNSPKHPGRKGGPAK